MRSLSKIEAEISETKRQIEQKQRLNNIAKFAGADELKKLLLDTRLFYESAMRVLDENSPVLSKEYGKLKACLALVNSFISGMETAEESLLALKRRFLDLNEELQKVQDESRRRERDSF